jgi:hypothetical protein
VRQFANPLEKATLESDEYEKCYVERMFVMAPALAIVAKELQSFKDFPASEARQLLDRRRDGEAFEHRRSGN